MFTPAPRKKSKSAPRGKTCGWTRNVSRRNTDFLLSVTPADLDGFGLALSLTVKFCPDTADDWAGVRRAFVKRLQRMGLVRLHWLTEWQRRGVPHLHMAVWFSGPVLTDLVLHHWLAVTAPYQSGRHAQYVSLITGAAGWFEYLAKHAARGVAHYQRSPENIPKGWKTRTGRMWGHVGEWPTQEAKEIDPPVRVWFQYRRLMIRYQQGKARRQNDLSRLRYLSRYRSAAPPETSRAQALPRMWLPEDHQWSLLACAFSSHSD